MPFSVCVLGSSSAGNSILVRSETTAVLVDAGFSAREIARRLAEVGLEPGALAAVCVSHEHADHTAGLVALQRRHGVPLYANAGTIEILRRDAAQAGLAWRVFSTGSPFEIGDLRFEPFAVPHDACDPVGFVVSRGAVRAGIATDLGMATTLIRERLRGCRVLVLESNHDEELLRHSRRPWALKQRILGRQGHLSNRGAVEMLLEIAGPGLEQVFLAHLSQECNDAAFALREVRRRLDEAGWASVRVSLTYPDRRSETWTGA
jgi:phosphoribosyl 1,2-cyclic phosphodiesterase